MIMDRQRVRRVRVLSIPGRRHPQNPYFPLLWHALEGAGVEMISARSLAALTLQYDILHVHLPENLVTERPVYSSLIAGPLFLAYVAVARAAGRKLVWTIHEIDPRRRHWLAQPYLWCMRKLANAYVFMNRTSEDEFFKRHPRQREKIIWRIPHSAYPITKISAARRSEVRASVTEGNDCLLVGFLGEIRPYKNMDALQYLPMTDAQGRSLRLVVGGHFHASCDVDRVRAMLRAIQPHRLARIGEREGLSDERLAELIQSVDIVFMPYLRGWNSGFAMFALGCGARLLCSGLPMFRELAQTLGPPWVYLFDHDAADLSQELATAVAQVSRDQPEATDRAPLEQFLADSSFARAASRYTDLYRNLLARSVDDAGAR
jgi:beta-1,4-mannosyltransferase